MGGSLGSSVEFWWGLCELVGCVRFVKVGAVWYGLWHPECFEIFCIIGRVGGPSDQCVNFSLLTAPGVLLFLNLHEHEYFCFLCKFVNPGTNV